MILAQQKCFEASHYCYNHHSTHNVQLQFAKQICVMEYTCTYQDIFGMIRDTFQLNLGEQLKIWVLYLCLKIGSTATVLQVGSPKIFTKNYLKWPKIFNYSFSIKYFSMQILRIQKYMHIRTCSHRFNISGLAVLTRKWNVYMNVVDKQCSI